MSAIALSFVLAAAGAVPNENSDDVRHAVESFARCTVKRKRALASTAVVEDWSVPMTIERKLITADCLHSGQLMASPISLRAAIGEALVVTQNDELPPARVATAPPLLRRDLDLRTASNGLAPAGPPPKIDRDKAAERYGYYISLSKLGECIIRADSAGARALLTTPLSSREESAAAQNLSPSIVGCASPETTAALSAEAIRIAVGLSYYRMEMAARGLVWRATEPTK